MDKYEAARERVLSGIEDRRKNISKRARYYDSKNIIQAQTPGKISIFYNGELLETKRFCNRWYRKQLMDNWQKTYKIGKAGGEVYFQVAFDE